MTICRFNLVVLILATAVLLVGCAKPKNQGEDILTRSYRLIDNQRTEEAITLLEESLEKEPENYDYKVALASAYAHSAGIKIQTLFPVVFDIKNLSKAFSPKKSKDTPKTNSGVNALIRLNIQIANLLSVYDNIPSVDEEASIYLVQAIRILSGLNEIRPEDAVYRGVLRVIYIKHLISHDLIDNSVTASRTANSCHLDLGRMSKTFLRLGQEMIEVLNDVERARPSQADQVYKWSENISSTTSEIMMATTALLVVDEASSLFLKKMVIQEGFGKLLTCSENGGDFS